MFYFMILLFSAGYSKDTKMDHTTVNFEQCLIQYMDRRLIRQEIEWYRSTLSKTRCENDIQNRFISSLAKKKK